MSKTVTEGMISATVDGLAINGSIPCNSGNYKASGSRPVSYVVMHYTGNAKDTAQANAKYFQGAGRKASAHFFVDENSICQSVGLHDIAWHCGAKQYVHASCRNSNSIGIEMCTSGNYKIAEQTREHAAQLCAYICRLLGITSGGVDTYVLRHYDVTHKKCPAEMVDDPGEWTAFRERVKQLLG